eukprot:13058902-Alexandrium_andersonii.AAC.1
MGKPLPRAVVQALVAGSRRHLNYFQKKLPKQEFVKLLLKISARRAAESAPPRTWVTEWQRTTPWKASTLAKVVAIKRGRSWLAPRWAMAPRVPIFTEDLDKRPEKTTSNNKRKFEDIGDGAATASGDGMHANGQAINSARPDSTPEKAKPTTPRGPTSTPTARPTTQLPPESDYYQVAVAKPTVIGENLLKIARPFARPLARSARPLGGVELD